MTATQKNVTYISKTHFYLLLMIAVVGILLVALMAYKANIYLTRDNYSKALEQLKAFDTWTKKEIYRFVTIKLKNNPIEPVYDIVGLDPPEPGPETEMPSEIKLDPDLDVFLSKLQSMSDESVVDKRIIYETGARLKIMQVMREIKKNEERNARYNEYIKELEKQLP